MGGILVTGFEPFGGMSVNASWEVASRLPSEIQGVRIVVKQLPVVYFESLQKVRAILKENEWITDIILLGEAGGIATIKVEMIGVNLDDTDVPDNKGSIRQDDRIIKDAPDGIFATIPVKRIVNHLKHQCSAPAAVSWSAGQFLCNHTLFGTLHELARAEKNVRAGFVHLPYTTAQGAASNKPGLPTDEMVRQIEQIIEFLISS